VKAVESGELKGTFGNAYRKLKIESVLKMYFSGAYQTNIWQPHAVFISDWPKYKTIIFSATTVPIVTKH
jgi:hypothetical protein